MISAKQTKLGPIVIKESFFLLFSKMVLLVAFFQKEKFNLEILYFTFFERFTELTVMKLIFITRVITFIMGLPQNIAFRLLLWCYLIFGRMIIESIPGIPSMCIWWGL